MYKGKDVVIVLLACNAVEMLGRIYHNAISQDTVDLVVDDDGNHYKTDEVARMLPDTVAELHGENMV